MLLMLMLLMLLFCCLRPEQELGMDGVRLDSLLLTALIGSQGHREGHEREARARAGGGGEEQT